MVNEAGEVAGKWKKWYRDGQFDKQAVVDEMGDVLWYLSQLASELDVDLGEIAQHNLDKLFDRKARGKLGGSGDKR